MIVAGEASGDLHGGALANALCEQSGSLEMIGFGGEAMRRAGVDIRFDSTRLAVVGLVEVLFQSATILAAWRLAVSLLSDGIDLLVLIDYPDFNLRLARVAKQKGIPVVYYVSPQIWAWRAGRIKQIAERVDRMLVVFPFEKPLYEAADIPCTFVGHPLVDDWRAPSYASRAAYLTSLGLQTTGPTVALLPGSRRQEVLSLLPAMHTALSELAPDFPGLQVIVSVAPSLSVEWIESQRVASPVPTRCVSDPLYDILGASDVAVVASGTATLQVALARVPMVIVYKLSWMTYFLMRALIRVKTIGLVNIVAGTPCVPELLQSDVSPTRIGAEVRRFLSDPAARMETIRRLDQVAEALGTPGASARAAEAILAQLQQGSSPQRKGLHPAEAERIRQQRAPYEEPPASGGKVHK